MYGTKQSFTAVYNHILYNCITIYDHVRYVIGAICMITPGSHNGDTWPAVRVPANLRWRVFVAISVKKLFRYYVLVAGRLPIDV